MKKMLRTATWMVVCLCLIFLASCEQDDDILFDYLVSYEWGGDLGFADAFDRPLESGLNFDGNGFGVDAQCYPGDYVHVAFELPFRWMIYDGTLTLDYGNDYPQLEICNIHISVDRMDGELYVDGEWDGPVTLFSY
ncbi:MAG: hypothetical protein ACI378_01480 [Bacteroides sp.]